MQIVIEIQDEIKDMCDNAKPEKAMQGIEWFNGTLYKAIKDGIVLPKGHGDLIDRDYALNVLRGLGDRDYRRSKGTICDASKMISYSEYVPTVIPADKEGTDESSN